ncbi:excalibur calcium-binding domain-containing protein [Kribbella sp. NPDC051770]|uniref:excalibur calcium-binding domain-containing protein n=1 Tax=Kribbella sp. NPDC051770 TaxID=3155413 RepID=UPI00341D0E4C
MDRGRAVLAVGTGLIALTLTGACAAPETTPAAAPVTVTVTTAPPPATTPPPPSTTTPAPKPTAQPTRPAGLLSAPPTTKPKLPQVTKKPTVKKPTPKPTTRRTTTKPVTSVYYKNCSEVRAAGAAPIRVGDPGYSRKLDRDGDGIACEN